jgi:hypothetical protein
MAGITAKPEHVLNNYLTSLRAGEPQHLDALELVSLHTDSLAPSLTYLTLAEAHAQHQIVVSEKAYAAVPTLQVINKAAAPVLVLDGEEIVGGRQNRVVNTTLLIPAQCTFELDVTCVEQSRWHPDAGESFAPGETLYPTLRQQKSAQVAASLIASGAPRTNQSAVWAEVEAMHQRRGTRSSTKLSMTCTSGGTRSWGAPRKFCVTRRRRLSAS